MSLTAFPLAPSVNHYAADRFSFAHERESLVNVAQRHRMRNHRIDLDPPVHVPINNPRHVSAAASAAKGGAAPYTAGHQLEWTCCNFLAGSGNTDNGALTPTAMAAFERGAHEIDITDAFKGVVGAADVIGTALGHVDEMGDQIAAEFGRIDEMRHAEAFAPGLLFRVHIDADNHVRADQAEALNDVQSDPAETEHDAFGASLDLGGIDHRPNAGRHPAADVADPCRRARPRGFLPPRFPARR
jgi:hypothetical protein